MLPIDRYWQSNGPQAIVTVVPDLTYRQLPPERMLGEAVEVTRSWRHGGANLPPSFFPDFGPVTMARPWGGRVERTEEGQIFIHPVATTLAEALAIRPARNPDVDLALDLFEHVRDASGCRELGFRTPDYQGVLNTAAMILDQEELMVSMHAEPHRLRLFLDRVCDANIAFLRELRARVGRLVGNIWPRILLPDTVGITVTEDYMPLLSPEMYRTFGLPMLRRISEEFGGVFIHCCGQYGRHVAGLAASGVRVLGLEYHYPFTSIDEIQEHITGAVLVPCLSMDKQSDYADFGGFLDDQIARVRGGNRRWVAMTDSGPVAEARQVPARRGIESFAGME